MARTELIAQDKPTLYDTDGSAITWTSVNDNGDGYYCNFSGNLLILAWNNGSTGSATVTIDSVATASLGNRTGDLTATLATGAMVAFLVPEVGFSQDGGKCLINVGSTGADDIDIAIFKNM